MNYITYKQIDGTITSGFKVKLYDIVTLNTGYWKDKLAIVLYIINDITADIIAKGIGQYITNTDSDRYSVSAIMWLSDIKDYIDALLKYGDFDFVAKAFKIYNITDTRFELICKLYNYSMIEDAIGYILGVCVGCILFLIYEVFNLYKKIERINIDINKLQIKDIEFHRNIEFIINDSKYNKEVLEHSIDKLNKLNDSIKAKVDD